MKSNMLSKAAFNGLLKILEEPPPHVKFIFATTEIRKVPVTILSRCQRFDLKRIEPEVMIAHLKSVCGTRTCARDRPCACLDYAGGRRLRARRIVFARPGNCPGSGKCGGR